MKPILADFMTDVKNLLVLGARNGWEWNGIIIHSYGLDHSLSVKHQ